MEIDLTYPFEVPVNDPEVVKVTHTGHDPTQLGKTKNGIGKTPEWAHQLQTVYAWIGPGVFHHVPILHPSGNHEERALIYGE